MKLVDVVITDVVTNLAQTSLKIWIKEQPQQTKLKENQKNHFFVTYLAIFLINIFNLALFCHFTWMINNKLGTGQP